MYDFKELDIEAYYRNPQGYLLADVRSPGEYLEDHIQGAVSIPLFTDDQRAFTGTLYKQEGAKAAKRAARDLILSRMPGMLRELDELKKAGGGRKLLIYCARGGDRSAVTATFLAMESSDTCRLTGGYKAYRRYVLDYFNNGPQWDVISLYGHTGTGKTELLQRLKDMGLPVIDLEGLAGHRGSVFGHVGLAPQPSQKRFDTLLFEALRGLSEGRCIVEGESKKIGRIYIPDSFYARMVQGVALLAKGSMKARIQRIIREYGGFLEENSSEILGAISCLKDQLGNRVVEELSIQYKEKELESLVAYLLKEYYDPLYDRNRKATRPYSGIYETDDQEACAREIADGFSAGWPEEIGKEVSDWAI